jgi:hypothetical protein
MHQNGQPLFSKGFYDVAAVTIRRTTFAVRTTGGMQLRATLDCQLSSWNPRCRLSDQAKSAPRTLSTTGQDVPGDPRSTWSGFGVGPAFELAMTSTAIGSPAFKTPRAKSTPHGVGRVPAPHHIQGFGDGALRIRAAATAMTELGKNQRLLTQYGDGVVLAHFCTLTAVGATGFVYLGDQDTHL